MVSFEKGVLSIAKRFDAVAGIAVFGMMTLTCADVILRLFRKPIPGTYEIVSLLGAVAVSFAIAHTSVERGHVSVSLIVQLFPRKVQRIVESVISVCGIVLFGLIAWHSVLYGMDCQRAGEVSQTLQLPFYPVIYGVAIGAGAVCLVLLLDLIDAIDKLINT